MNLYCRLILELDMFCVGKVGGFETETPVFVEPSLKYHPEPVWFLTRVMNLVRGQFQLGSLTGAVSSQRVTEEPNGTLSLVGNQA